MLGYVGHEEGVGSDQTHHGTYDERYAGGLLCNVARHDRDADCEHTVFT